MPNTDAPTSSQSPPSQRQAMPQPRNAFKSSWAMTADARGDGRLMAMDLAGGASISGRGRVRLSNIGGDRGLCRAGDQVPTGQGERRDGQGEATHKAALQG
jgi:hypothetical protein